MMFSKSELETLLTIGFVLICLGACINIYWILNGWQIDAIRRAFARRVWRCQVESYVEGLRKLVEDEGVK